MSKIVEKLVQMVKDGKDVDAVLESMDFLKFGDKMYISPSVSGSGYDVRSHRTGRMWAYSMTEADLKRVLSDGNYLNYENIIDLNSVCKEATDKGSVVVTVDTFPFFGKNFLSKVTIGEDQNYDEVPMEESEEENMKRIEDMTEEELLEFMEEEEDLDTEAFLEELLGEAKKCDSEDDGEEEEGEEDMEEADSDWEDEGEGEEDEEDMEEAKKGKKGKVPPQFMKKGKKDAPPEDAEVEEEEVSEQDFEDFDELDLLADLDDDAIASMELDSPAGEEGEYGDESDYEESTEEDGSDLEEEQLDEKAKSPARKKPARPKVSAQSKVMKKQHAVLGKQIKSLVMKRKRLTDMGQRKKMAGIIKKLYDRYKALGTKIFRMMTPDQKRRFIMNKRKRKIAWQKMLPRLRKKALLKRRKLAAAQRTPAAPAAEDTTPKTIANLLEERLQGKK